MQIKRNNRYFLYFIILVTAAQLWVGRKLPRWSAGELITYLACFGLGVLMLKRDGTPLTEVLPYHVGLKPGTALLIVALTFTLAPLSCALSELGARFGGDMIELVEQYMDRSGVSFVETLFMAALLPAVFEEMYFRGFFYAGFRRARGARCAVLMTSVLFGFFHMNLQQIAYASVLGVFIALLRELTGSMWAGMLIHFVNNAWSCVEVAVPKDSFLLKLPLERVTFTGEPSQIVSSCVMLVVCTAASVWIIFRIAKREGRLEDLKRFFPRAEREKGKLFTAPLVIACVLLVLGTAASTLILLLYR